MPLSVSPPHAPSASEAGGTGGTRRAALTKADSTPQSGALTAQKAELEAKIAELRGALDESRRTPTVIQQSAPAARLAPASRTRT
jgi:hypothetical protein